MTATAPARLYGLAGKGRIAPGCDADLVIWDPERSHTYGADDLHDNVGYTPYEGMTLTGWPVRVFVRGRTVVADGELLAERGSGAFLRCALPESARPRGMPSPELDPTRNFGARL